jgi:hypothetical protein|tara:strand:- start:1550 stop:1954 length:405 start_codon:yes stop_codon:yes gene_type:complete
MAIRSVASTDTLGTLRTTFNSLGTDVGDLANLTTSDTSNIVSALNEVRSQTSSIFVVDESSTTTEIESGESLNISGGTNLTTALTGDKLDITLNTTITGLTSITSTTGVFTNLTLGGIDVATKPFAIAQSIALG